MLKRVSKRANDLAGGILTIDVESKGEMDAIDKEMGSDLTSVDRIYKKPGREIGYVTPDLKIGGEFNALFDILSRKLCRHMRITQFMLDGEHTGASLGGSNDSEILTSYTEIFQIQEHYRNNLEHIFFKLGKKDTRFIYNNILPEHMMPDDEIMDGGLGDEENDQKEKTDKSNNDKPSDGKTDAEK